MTVVTVPITINPTKETKEVIDALAKVGSLIKKAVSAGDKSLIYKEGVGLLDEIYVAIEGGEKIAVELKSKNIDDNLSYMIKTLGSEFIPGAAGDEADGEL